MKSPQQQLEESITDSLVGLYMHGTDGDFVPVDDKYGVIGGSLITAAKEFALAIVGEDEPRPYKSTIAELRRNLVSNELKAELRSKIEGR